MLFSLFEERIMREKGRAHELIDEQVMEAVRGDMRKIHGTRRSAAYLMLLYPPKTPPPPFAHTFPLPKKIRRPDGPRFIVLKLF